MSTLTLSREADVVAQAAHRISTAADYDRLIELAGEAQFVLIGEASHGTRDFYATRAERLGSATDWVLQEPAARDLRIGYFGSSTSGGAALVAAAGRPHAVGAVVSRGGRPDLAGNALPNVKAPTLLIVGGAARRAGIKLGAPQKESKTIRQKAAHDTAVGQGRVKPASLAGGADPNGGPMSVVPDHI